MGDAQLYGVGGDSLSWAFDGSRQCKLHDNAKTPYGLRWHIGDVLGCWVDCGPLLSNGHVTIGYSLNGTVWLAFGDVHMCSCVC